MPTRKIRVRKYQRFKNGKWESVKKHEREISTVTLSDAVLKDIREGKAVRLETEGVEVFRVPKEQNLLFGFGDYFGMGMSDKEIIDYEILHELEIKAQNEGLTEDEYKEFKKLVKWTVEENKKEGYDLDVPVGYLVTGISVSEIDIMARNWETTGDEIEKIKSMFAEEEHWKLDHIFRNWEGRDPLSALEELNKLERSAPKMRKEHAEKLKKKELDKLYLEEEHLSLNFEDLNTDIEKSGIDLNEDTEKAEVYRQERDSLNRERNRVRRRINKISGKQEFTLSDFPYYS